MVEPGPQWQATAIIANLRTLASDHNRTGMSRYGIETSNALGVSNATLRPMAKKLGRNHERAVELWQSGIREARLLAIFTEEPDKVSKEQARQWANEFASWEIVDHAADLFVDAGLLMHLVPEFAADEREFVRRTAFAMIAWAAVHLKKTPDEKILAWLPLIEEHAGDNRNYVRKAVNWSLRQIGKRSMACHAPALALARKLSDSFDKAERWVGRGALKELTDPKTLERIRSKK